MNRRVWREADEDQDGTPDEEIIYVWDGWRNIEERDYTTEDLLRDYVYGGAYIDEVVHGRSDFWDGSTLGPDGDFADSKEQFYYTTNNLYSVAALVDASGSVIERYEYLPYGAVTTYTGAGVDSTWFTSDDATSSYSDIQHVTFTGRRSDPESELMHFRNRYYSAELGRFVGRDSAGYLDGMNVYGAYFVPDGIDPFGQEEGSANKKGESCCNFSLGTSGLNANSPWNRPIQYGVLLTFNTTLVKNESKSGSIEHCRLTAWFGGRLPGKLQPYPTIEGVDPINPEGSSYPIFFVKDKKGGHQYPSSTTIPLAVQEGRNELYLSWHHGLLHNIFSRNVPDEKLGGKRRYTPDLFEEGKRYTLTFQFTAILSDKSKKNSVIGIKTGKLVLSFEYAKGDNAWWNIISAGLPMGKKTPWMLKSIGLDK